MRILDWALCAALSFLVSCKSTGSSLVLNDVHSRLNSTTVAEYHEPTSRNEIMKLVLKAKKLGKAISISGGRHSMGGQQFAADSIHVSMSAYKKVLALDPEKGLVTVESGIQWPELIDWLVKTQKGKKKQWAIRQKQTGADHLSIGGALSTNIHGRGLSMKPMVGDVEEFELIDAEGKAIRCSRMQNKELFGLVIGGYGLFGVITEVTLRLSPRTKLKRVVEIVALDQVPKLVQSRIKDGYEYGDYQFKTDEKAGDFLRTGVFSFYKPVPPDTEIREDQKQLSGERWSQLYQLAHLDKSKAFQLYSEYYKSTTGQVYWSDTHQMAYYVQGYDELVDKASGARAPGSLMICEFYVARPRLPEFLKKTGEVIRAEGANLVYGTVRYIEKDDETFLPWAREPFASTVMNLRVTHDKAGIDAAARQFQAIIDVALSMGGSYFLTYHRWARKDQVLKAYPQFPEFLNLKRKFDPEERFQSDWYRHYRTLFFPEAK